MLVAVLCTAYLGSFAAGGVPQAVVDSQRQFVAALARSLDAAVDRSVSELDEAAARYADKTVTEPAKLLAMITNTDTAWAGTAVLDAATRQPVAAQGEPLSAEHLTTGITRTTVRPIITGGEARVLVVAPLPDGRLLAGTTVLRLRTLRLNPDAQHGVLLGLLTGETAQLQGASPDGGEQVAAQIRRTVAATVGRDVASTTGEQVPTSSQPGPDTALLVTAAPAGVNGMAVVSVIQAPVAPAGSPWRGVPAAAGLLVIAGLGFLLVRTTLIRPVRRLLEQAKADACGDCGPRARLDRPSEVRRIAAALAGTDDGAGSEHRRTAWRRRGLPASTGVLAATALTVCWSAAVGVTLGAGAVEVPMQVVRDTENQIEAATSAVGDALDSGLTELRAIATQHANAQPDQLRPVLKRLARKDRRFRGLYVVNENGGVALTAGRAALRCSDPVPGEGGIQLDNISGRLPVIYAYAQVAGGRSIVGEFDLSYLTALLRRVDGRTRIVDSELRTILDTDGYRAFQNLPAGPQRAAAIDALGGDVTAAVRVQHDKELLVAGAPLRTPPSAAHLEWALVGERAVSELALPPNDLRRGGLLLAGIAIAIALLSLGWHYFVLLRPLRRLADTADDLASGRGPETISPHRHDEIGAIAACLEICRQVKVLGTHRLGGAVRLRGAEDDFTVVMPRIAASRASIRTPIRSL